MAFDAEPSTLVELCLWQAKQRGEALAVWDEATGLSYRELARRSASLAAALRENGVRAGDRVVLCGRNSVAWVEVAFATLFAGATLVPIGYGAPEAERARVVERVGPRLVVAVSGEGWPSGLNVLTPEELDSRRVAAPPPHLPAADDVAVILSTSGTTGEPKLVPMTHGQLTRCYAEVARRLELRADDRLLGAVPLAHSFGLNGVLLIGLHVGAAIRLVPHYRAEELSELVRGQRLTVIVGPPTIFVDLAAGDGKPVPGCRMAITGGADVSLRRMRQACSRAGIERMFVGYGLTETCGTVAVGEVPERGVGDLAKLTPLRDLEVQIVDEQGRPLPTGAEGRIWVRGHNVMPGYLHQEAATRRVLRTDGWLDTADIGRRYADGDLSIVSRARDVVIVSGFNVYPREVEHVLGEHGSVAQAVVLGLPDERQGQRLVACLVPAPGTVLDTQELLAYCRERLAAFKVPRTMITFESLPTTETGKVSRPAVRRLLRQESRSAVRCCRGD